MLFPTLILMTALSTTQDVVATEETSAEVIEFLRAAQDTLYDPEAHGLESLEFDMPIGMPTAILEMLAGQMGQTLDLPPGDIVLLGSVRVKWTAGNEPEFLVSRADGVPQGVMAITQMMGLTDQQFPIIANQALTAALNRTVTLEPILESHIATLEGDVDGLMKVAFMPKAERPDAPPMAWFFDADKVPVKSVISVDQPNQMGGTTESLIRGENSWEAVGDDGRLLVATQMQQEGGPMSFSQSVDYEFEWIDGVPILTGYTEKSTPMGQSFTRIVVFGELRVNGDLVSES